MKNDKKQELIELMRKYVNENNCIDIQKLHNENQKEYALLPHYFGSVNDAIKSQGWVKINKPQGSNRKMTTRDELALFAIDTLRANGKTFEEIAEQFNITKAGISQLHKALKAAYELTKEI